MTTRSHLVLLAIVLALCFVVASPTGVAKKAPQGDPDDENGSGKGGHNEGGDGGRAKPWHRELDAGPDQGATTTGGEPVDADTLLVAHALPPPPPSALSPEPGPAVSEAVMPTPVPGTPETAPQGVDSLPEDPLGLPDDSAPLSLQPERVAVAENLPMVEVASLEAVLAQAPPGPVIHEVVDDSQPAAAPDALLPVVPAQDPPAPEIPAPPIPIALAPAAGPAPAGPPVAAAPEVPYLPHWMNAYFRSGSTAPNASEAVAAAGLLGQDEDRAAAGPLANPNEGLAAQAPLAPWAPSSHAVEFGVLASLAGALALGAGAWIRRRVLRERRARTFGERISALRAGMHESRGSLAELIQIAQNRPLDGELQFQLAVQLLRAEEYDHGLARLDLAFRLLPENVLPFLEEPAFAPLRERPDVRDVLRRFQRTYNERLWTGYA